MSILDFLASVFGRLIDIFQNWWANVFFVVQTAYTKLHDYYYRLFYVLDFFNRDLKSSSVHYRVNVRPKSDVIDLFNYGKVVYSAIDSFPNISRLNTTFAPMLTAIGGTVYNRMMYVFQSAYAGLEKMLNVPGHLLDYVFGFGQLITKQYSNYERPSLLRFMFGENKFMTLVEPTFFGRLGTYALTLFAPAVDIMQTNYPKIQSLIQSAQKVAHLASTNVFPKISALFTTEYSGFKAMLDIGSNILDFFQPPKQAKINYLLDKGMAILNGLIETPDDTILGMIRDKFLSWIGNLLYEWLMSPAEE